MSRSRFGRSSLRRPLAAVAAALAVVVLATEFEAVVHRHGEAWSRTGELSALPSSDTADPERPCSICRLADTSSQALTDPVAVAAPCVVEDEGLPPSPVRPAARPEPVRSPRAPPRPVAC